MKRVYISLPITGRDLTEVRQEAASIAERIKAEGFEPINPFEVSDDDSRSYAEHMGKDITALLECDAIYLADGWRKSKGCTLEYCAARIYNKQIYQLK